MKRIKNKEELDKLKAGGCIGSGTHSTGKFALEQGKPVFAAFPDDKVDWKKFMEENKMDIEDKILKKVIKEFKDRDLLNERFDEEFGSKSFDEVANSIALLFQQ